MTRDESDGDRGPAVCGCGRPGYEQDQVSIHLRAGAETGEVRAGVSNVYRCGSPWLCSVCAVHKAKERAERVRAVAEATYARDGQVALVVLTASHSAAMPLAEIKALVQGSSAKARKGKAWVGLTERYGILGVVVGQEITFSRAHGCHYHQHLNILVDGPTDEESGLADGDAERLKELVQARAQAAGEAVAERYKASIRASGGKVSDLHGTYVRVAEDEADAADYTAKGSMSWEVAGGPSKDSTRATDSLTPWDIAELAYDGDRWARARWREYMEEMPGTRSCVVSAALAAKLGIAPVDDEEGGDMVYETDEVVGQVAADIWRRWMRHGLASTFLARVERGGAIDFDGSVERTQHDAAVIEDRFNRRQSETSPRPDDGRKRVLRFIEDAAADEESCLIPDGPPPPTEFILRMREDIAEKARASAVCLAA